MQNDKFHGENIQVGDKVIVYVVSHQRRSYHVGKVTKRTPTGLLDVEWGGRSERFRNNGTEYHRSDGFYRTSYYLEDYTEERGKEIEKEKLRNK